MPRVTVTIEWPPGLQSLPADARARVTVEDATRADASSVVVGTSILTDLDLSHAPAAEVDVENVDPNALLIARVHVAPAARQSLEVEIGDLISTASHPVLTRGQADSVVVPLHLVGS